jgi:hypothetical protein
MAIDVKDITEAYAYHDANWSPIRKEGAEDMKFVAGNPWNKADDDARKNRPTVAPEEMGQYFNQVINALRANPRGAKFSPTGNGANDKTARFYQNKWREIEYRSHAQEAYISAAENAIQRSYGFVRVNTKYGSPRSANQDIWLEPFPNPDMVLPDTDAIRRTGEDMACCFVYQFVSTKAFDQKYRGAKRKSFGELSTIAQGWVRGDKVRVAEYWCVTTTPKQLVLVEIPAPAQPQGQPGMPGMPMPAPQAAPPMHVQVFADETEPYLARGARVVRDLRKVDYPKVQMHLTNGVEILHTQDWNGKYIPIVSCYGKVLYVEGEQGMERKILSMTRFGRDPWKSYCYACSQELEILSMVPKAPVRVWAGQLRGGLEKDWQEAPHVPKAYLQAHHHDEDGNPYPSAPERLTYIQAEYLQAVEIVKEGFRRAIQSAMGSNFLPTQAQRRNEKSGIALEKMDQAATQGTYHFVDAYEDMIRQCAVIGEDLMDKIHDYAGDVDTIEPNGDAIKVRINDPQDDEAISTRGDHVVTISTAPSSDSERTAAEAFTDVLVSKIDMIAGVSGQKQAAAILAQAIRMRNLGPMGDQLADLIEPPEFKRKPDGERPNPEVLALQAENQQLKGVLQQASTEKQSKVVEIQGKYAIAQMQEQHEDQRAAMDREVKLAVAELGAKVDRMQLFIEERERVGAHIQAALDRVNTALEASKDRAHDVVMARQGHQHALEAAEQGNQHAREQTQIGVAGQMALADQAAANQPAEGEGAGA